MGFFSRVAESNEDRERHKKITQYFAQGKYREAIPLLDKALDFAAKAAGRESKEVAAILSQLGFIHYLLGELPEAIAALEAALGIIVKGQVIDATPKVISFLHSAYLKAGRQEDAEWLEKKFMSPE